MPLKRNNKMKNIYTLSILLILFTQVIGQNDTITSKQLDEVVVTGQYQPQSVKRSLYQVKVITKERISKQGASKLQDVLANELNIRFSQDPATGGSNINMLGLSGQNVKILIDGVPMTGRQGTSNEININQVDVNTIERIEIVEGPMSVIYGADALAGVINIITKKPRAEKLSVTARIHEESVGNEYGIEQGIHNPYAGISWQGKGFQLSGGIGRNYFGGWKGNSTGRELDWHKKDQITANALAGYRKGRFNIYYRFDGLDEIITNPGEYKTYDPNTNDTLALDQEYLTQRTMHQLQSSYSLNNRLSFQAVASYTDYFRQVYSTTVAQRSGDVRLAIGSGLQDITTFQGYTFRGIALYNISKVVSLQPGVDINLEKGTGERIKAGENHINDYAFFVTSEIKPDEKISIRPGLRFINNSVYDAPPVVPSLNARFGVSEKLDVRLAYASGFRAPSIRELYFDFFDANHQIEGNQDLKAETSNSFTASAVWRTLNLDAVKINTTFNAFYNDVENMIGIGQKEGSSSVFTYLNIEEYKTRGASFSMNMLMKNFDATVGLGYTGRYNDYIKFDEELPEFNWSPEINAVISYSFRTIGLSANLFYKYTGKLPYYEQVTVNNQTEIRLAETEGYHWADFTLNKNLFKYLTLNAGVRNIFDVTTLSNSTSVGGVHTSSGERSIGYGRSFFAGLVFNWEKK